MSRSRSTGRATKRSAAPSTSKRSYLKQSDVPNASLDEALRVPKALFDHFAGKPTSPLQVAKALNVDPMGSQLKVLTGAAIAFGLIEGGAQAATISVTPLSTRIIRPKAEDEETKARRAAVLKPRVFREFLEKYNGHLFPRDDIAVNVLEEMDVPRLKTAEVLERLIASAKAVGFVEVIKDKIYVTLTGSNREEPTDERDDQTSDTTLKEEAVDASLDRPVSESGGAIDAPTNYDDAECGSCG
jgi:hypothetical protein